MNDRSSPFSISIRCASALSTLIAFSLGAVTVAQAADPLGLYVGAGYGQAHIRVRPGVVIPGTSDRLGDLDSTHSAFKAIIGVRPLSLIGAEVSYMDFGKVSTVAGQQLPASPGVAVIANSEAASQRGEAAFALLYLPVPVIDAYVKAGLSRITTEYNVAYTALRPGVGTCVEGQPDCAVIGTFNASRDSTDISFAYGAGVQWKLGNWAVRGEYERFDAAGANPSLWSVAMTYWL